MRFPLAQAHPQLFKSMLLKVGTLIAVSLAMLLRPHWIVETALRRSDSVIPFPFWGLCFLAIALMFLYGITGSISRFRWARRALIAGSVVAGIWAVTYIFALFGGKSDRVLATIFWVYIDLNFIIWAGEPTFNPISSALSDQKFAGEIKDYVRQQ